MCVGHIDCVCVWGTVGLCGVMGLCVWGTVCVCGERRPIALCGERRPIARVCVWGGHIECVCVCGERRPIALCGAQCVCVGSGAP